MTIKTKNPQATQGRGRLAGCAAALLGALLLAAPAPEVRAEETFIFAHPAPEEHPLHRMSQVFLDKLEEIAGDEFDVAYHYGGDLGDWTSQFEQTKVGALPMTICFGFAAFDPRLDISWMGYIVDSWQQAREVFGPDGPVVPVYQEIFSDLNMELIGTVPSGFFGIAMRKGDDRVPVDFPADAQGIKLRVPPIKVAIERFEALGFSPVPMPYPEQYTAMQLGTVDGRGIGPTSEVWTMRDVHSTYVFTRDGFEHAFWVANKDWWATLSDDQKAKLKQAVHAAMEWGWANAEADEARDLERLADYGITIVHPTEDQVAAAKELVYQAEWPWMEERVGKDLINNLRNAAGLQ